ncbi:MAG: hypothetical protein IJM19_07210 [Ruminococcus sp.]|nr:hypothetical protein [Ruminococcus sp.]MBR6385383.1 hypothetical protein [Ruminococcus sp.]
MRKILFALALCMAVVCSCGEKSRENTDSSEISAVSETEYQRIVNDYEDGILVGQWKDEQASIMVFNEDGSVDAVMDVSSFMHFTEQGTLILDTNEIASDFVRYDGSVVDVSYTNEETNEKVQLIYLERKDSPDEKNLNGRYKFTGGTLFDSLSANLGIKGDSSLDFIINGEECLISVNNSCSYSQDGDILDFKGDNPPFKTQEHGDCYFVLDGDKLTIYSDFENKKSVFEKIK